MPKAKGTVEPLPNAPNFEEWESGFLDRAAIASDDQFDLGDRMLIGETHFGAEKVSQVVDRSGLVPLTLANYKSTAKRFPIGKRRPGIGYAIHEVVRTLDDAALDAAFEIAKQKKLSREAMRKRVSAYKKGDLGALNPDWVPPENKTVVEDATTIPENEDKPVFDSTDAGVSIAEEQRDTERASFEANDANQDFMKACRIIEKLDIRMLNLGQLSRDALQASIAKLREIAMDKAHHDQAHLKPSAAPVRRAVVDGEEEAIPVFLQRAKGQPDA